MGHLAQRRSIRLKNYDYADAGAYFITICAWRRDCLFGDIDSGGMHLNKIGQIISSMQEALSQDYPHIKPDLWVIMPNHVHGIITIIDRKNGASEPQQKTPGIGEIVRGFKARCTRKINQLPIHPDSPIWQRNYYERIIRNEQELATIRKYIANNPLQWDIDKNNPRYL